MYACMYVDINTYIQQLDINTYIQQLDINTYIHQLPAVIRGLTLSQTNRIPEIDVAKIGDIPVGQIEECAAAAFQSRCWREADFSYFELKKPHRQTDEVFVGQLRRLRYGDADAQTDEFWMSLNRPLPESEV